MSILFIAICQILLFGSTTALPAENDLAVFFENAYYEGKPFSRYSPSILCIINHYYFFKRKLLFNAFKIPILC